jgi:hypothetical protein
MANTDKNIVITPNNGSASDPNIVFSGANATTGAQNITLTVTPNNSGTVAFSGSAGQLLAINNDISNTLSTGGTISATGNITANNFVGNLVGNVTGNFSGSLANGNSNVSIPAANGNVNISAVGNANIVVVTGTGANVNGTLSVSGNANVGNIGATNGVFTNVSGNGSSLTSITGANVTGQVANALVSGTVYTAAQPNITSVGTLSSLSVSGTATLAAVNGTDASFSGNATVNGNLFVNGNLTYLNVETVAVEDPIIQLQTGANGAAPIANSGKDVGTALNYYDTAAKIAFMGWDVSNAEIAFGSNVSITNEVVTFTSLANTRSGNTLTTGVFANTLSATGNITGGNLITSGLVSVTGAVTASSYTATNTTGTAFTLSNTGNTVGKFYENSSTIKIEAIPTGYGVALASNGATRLNIDANGYSVIGTNAGTVTGYSLAISRPTSGGTTAGSLRLNAAIQPDVTTTALYSYTTTSTAANSAPYTITNVIASGVYGGTIGANSTVTNQYGYYVDATLTGATNDFGFFGGLAAASGVWNLYMNGTANNYLGGSLGLGATTLTEYTFRNLLPITGASTSYQNQSGGVVQSDVTQAVYNSTTAGTAAASFALTSLYHYQVNQGTIGAGSSVTSQYGFNVASSMVGATNNYGYSLDYNELAGRWGIYFAGSAQNYINGSLGLGSTSVGLTTGINFRSSRVLSGSTSAYGVLSDGQIQSDVTSVAVLYRSTAQTQAAAFTLPNIVHYQAVQGTFGANSAVTTQVAFGVDTSLTGATNNYGFRSTLQSGTGRYNLYLEGTATNYLNGFTGFGTNNPLVAVQIGGGGDYDELRMARSGDFATASAMVFAKSRGTELAQTIVQDGDTLGTLLWNGNDGSGSTAGSVKIGAQIDVKVDGTPGTGNIPGRMMFYTTSSTGVTTERMRINSSGNVGIGNGAPTNTLAITGTLYVSSSTNVGSLTTTGNITGGNLIGIFANGNSSISIPTANGNINISAGGSPNEIVITSTGINVAGTLSVSGNANVGNLGTTGVFATTLSATGNANVGNLGVSGLISATGALTASSYTASNSLAGYFLANTGTTVGKIFENANIIKLEAIPATYGVALAANGTVQLSFDANGYGAIGSSSGTTGYALRIAKNTTGAVTAGSILINPTVQTDVTSLATGVRTSLNTAAGASPYTITNLVGYATYGGTIGANTTVTNQIAYYVDANATGGTNNWGFYGGLASAASTFNLYMQGTANNYLGGSLGIGSTSLSAINMRVSKSLTGGTTAFNFVSDGTIQSDVTTNAVLNRVVGQTQAATFTLTNLIYNQAVQGTFGLNSTVTTQSGFTADNTLTGATNNYGFRGSIASGANRFNLYMDGTANNYSAGNLGIGTTSPAVALHVKQNAGSINVEGTDQAYIQFYPRTVANIRTAYVGIGSAGSNNFTIRNDDNGRLLLESGNSNVSVFANGNVTTTVAGVANVVVVTSTGANIAGTLSATGNITGNFFIGNGSQLTGITTATSLANGNSNIAIPVANGNINFSIGGAANEVVFTSTGANVNGYLSVSGNANIANIGTAGLITATGNITGGNFTTTGANGTVTANNLTLTGAASGNVNVAATLSNLGLRTVAATYTDTAVTGTQANGAIHYIAVPTITGGTNAKTYTNMATFHIAGPVTASTNATITTNYALFVASGNTFLGGTLSATGNITGGNLSGTLVTGTLTTAAQPNITSVGTLTSLSVTGNITGGNLIGRLANGNSNVNIPAANGNINLSSAGNANIVVVTGTGANVTGTLNVTGNTTFSGVGQRILGDFSNATLSSRTAFQDKTTNGVTGVNILPNGTATETAVTAFNNSNPTNAAYINIGINSTRAALSSANTGSGTALPLVFNVGAGAPEVARFDTSGRFLIGGTTPLQNNRLEVTSQSGSDGVATLRNGGAGAGSYWYIGPDSLNNYLTYKNGGTGAYIANGGTSWTANSDERLKVDLVLISNAVSKVNTLRAVTGRYITDPVEKSRSFLIAQDVQAVLPEAVTNTPEGYLGLSYTEVIPLLVASVKELTALVTQLQTEVNNLKNP